MLNASLYHELYGLETVCLRYFNVFGPRQDPMSLYSGVIAIFMTKAVQERQPVIYGNGNQFRDFVYVKDVVKDNLLASEADQAGGGVFNIGTGRHVSIRDLWCKIAVMADINLEPQYAEPRSGDIVESVADIGQARTVLGYNCEYTFDRGLRRTYARYRNRCNDNF